MSDWVAGIAGSVAGRVAGAAVDTAMAPLNAVAGSVADTVGDMFATLATMWVKLSVPDVWHGSASPTVQALQSDVAPVVGLLAVLGIIVGGCRLAWEQHQGRAVDIVQGLMILVLVTGCGVPMIGLLTSGSDAFANSVIDHAVANSGNGDFGKNLMLLLGSPPSLRTPVAVILFGIIALLLSAAQVILLAFRACVLILLAGLLPASAAMATTVSGRQHFQRVVAWIIALAAYKPVAALIYATSFRLIGTNLGGGGIGAALLGLAMMGTAVLALPALLRVLVPAFGALQTPTPNVPSAGMPKGARIVRGLF